ncbi:MAG: ABC transporter ATP-binding protein [Burkholderiaceae bacterium]|nr:ABC transporter ATP-binding protein [Burkholderiaceae bacterium]
MSSPVLETRSLVKRFGGLTATDHVSLSLLPGEVHALIGPNGAGKTTLIGQLTGELMPDSGSVLLDGADVTRLPVAARARRGLGRSYQITQFCADFSALDNVAMAVMARSGSPFGIWRPLHAQHRIIDQAHAALDIVGLAGQAAVRAGVMAHGEHRQLELAMALALEPRLLLLDEPLAGMSGAESEVMVNLLLRLRGRYPMLLVEHDMGAVFALSDRISVLVYGQVLACGTPEQIRRNVDVRAAYLGDEGLSA